MTTGSKTFDAEIQTVLEFLNHALVTHDYAEYVGKTKDILVVVTDRDLERIGLAYEAFNIAQAYLNKEGVIKTTHRHVDGDHLEGPNYVPHLFEIILDENFKVAYKKLSMRTDETGGVTILYYEDRFGFYCNKETRNPRYEIKNKSIRLDAFKCIRDTDGVSAAQLQKELKRDYVIISHAISDFNRLIRTKLLLDSDLIIRLKTKGYSINREKFKLKGK